jgi:hypothetical protein
MRAAGTDTKYTRTQVPVYRRVWKNPGPTPETPRKLPGNSPETRDTPNLWTRWDGETRELHHLGGPPEPETPPGWYEKLLDRLEEIFGRSGNL